MSFPDATMSIAEIDEEDKKSQSDEDIMNRSLDSEGSKRGRPLVAFCWTRVQVVEDMDLANIRIFPIATDLALDTAMPYVPPKKRTEALWAPLFHPN